MERIDTMNIIYYQCCCLYAKYFFLLIQSTYETCVTTPNMYGISTSFISKRLCVTTANYLQYLPTANKANSKHTL